MSLASRTLGGVCPCGGVGTRARGEHDDRGGSPSKAEPQKTNRARSNRGTGAARYSAKPLGAFQPPGGLLRWAAAVGHVRDILVGGRAQRITSNHIDIDVVGAVARAAGVSSALHDGDERVHRSGKREARKIVVLANRIKPEEAALKSRVLQRLVGAQKPSYGRSGVALHTTTAVVHARVLRRIVKAHAPDGCAGDVDEP